MRRKGPKLHPGKRWDGEAASHEIAEMFAVARVGGRMRSLGHCYGEDADMMKKGPRRIKVSVQIEQEQRDVKLKDRLKLSLSLKKLVSGCGIIVHAYWLLICSSVFHLFAGSLIETHKVQVFS